LIELANEKKNDGEPLLDEKVLTEPLSSIFGIFTITDKNDFYKDYSRKLNHNSWKDIVEDFALLPTG